MAQSQPVDNCPSQVGVRFSDPLRGGMVEVSLLAVERTVFLADFTESVTVQVAQCYCQHLRVLNAHLHNVLVR